MDDLLLQLLFRVGTRRPGGDTHFPVYAVAQAQASAQSVIDAAAGCAASQVIICGADAGIGKDPTRPNEPANGYEGWESWSRRLVNGGVPPRRIAMTVGARVNGGYTAKGLNTLTEMKALVALLTSISMMEVTLIAPVFHLPRAMVSFITALRARQMQDGGGMFIKAQGHPVSAGNWTQSLVHSQGSQAGTIEGIAQAELAKISGEKRYCNLLPLSEVIAYFNERDG